MRIQIDNPILDGFEFSRYQETEVKENKYVVTRFLIITKSISSIWNQVEIFIKTIGERIIDAVRRCLRSDKWRKFEILIIGSSDYKI